MVVSQLHDKVEGWISLWNLPVEDERALLKLIVESLSKSQQDLQSRKFLVRFLHTYDSVEFPVDVQGIALEAALSAVKSDASAYEDRSLMLEGLSRQKSLSADLTVLAGLLRVMSTGTLSEYRDFQQKHAAALQRLGTNADQTLHTMRLMTLCAFCMGKQKVSYADIATRLEVDVAEVEDWVVQAIASGLIEASMDQALSVVHIARSFHGSFGKEQWQQLHTRLVDWRRSVASVLSTMKKQE
jgi:translation initiation factor 3 subunit M